MFGDGPKVGIVVPAYNVGEYLGECLASISSQTYGNFAVFVVDDASEDETSRVCEERCAADRRFRFSRHTSNQGVSSSRNDAFSSIEECDYYLFADADDWLERDMLSKLVDSVLRDGADMAMCNTVDEYADIGGRPRPSFGVSGPLETEDARLFVLDRSVTLWNKLISRDVLVGIAFDEELAYSEDSLFLAEALVRVRCLSVVDEWLYHYRIDRAGNVVSSPLDERHLDILVSFGRQVEIMRESGPAVLSASLRRAVKAMRKVLLRLGESRPSNRSASEVAAALRRYSERLLEERRLLRVGDVLICEAVRLSPLFVARAVAAGKRLRGRRMPGISPRRREQ